MQIKNNYSNPTDLNNYTGQQKFVTRKVLTIFELPTYPHIKTIFTLIPSGLVFVLQLLPIKFKINRDLVVFSHSEYLIFEERSYFYSFMS